MIQQKTLPKNQETNQHNKVTPLFPESIQKVDRQHYYPKDLFPDDISKENLENILSTSTEYIFVYDVKPFYEVHTHLLQGCIVKDIYYEDPNKYKFILFNQAYFFDNVYKKIDARYKGTSIFVIHKDNISMDANKITYNPNLINESDEKEIENNKTVEIEKNDESENVSDNTAVKELASIINVITKLYIDNSYLTKIKLAEAYKELKLNKKIKELYSDKKEIASMYSAISFFNKLKNKNSFDKSYEIASNHYKININNLKSVVGSINRNKRNPF